MWGCITPLVACRRFQHTFSSLLAHAEVLQRLGVGPANVSSSSSLEGGRPAQAALQAAAAAPCQPYATTSNINSCWFSSSRSLSSVADDSGANQSHSNEAEGAANEPERQLTRQIRDAADVADLQQVVSDCCDSFNFIHTAAALTKCANLSRSGQGDSELLQQQLAHKWLQQLHEAGVRECANVLWACTHLSREQVDAVWGQTWAAFTQRMQQGSEQGLWLQDITNAVHVAAELRRQPAAGKLQLLVQTFLQPDMLQGAGSELIAGTAWILNQLLVRSGLQGVISEQDMQQLRIMQQLLGEQQEARLIMWQISLAETLEQLSDVSTQLIGGFKSIHTAVALGKCAKLSSEGQTNSQGDSQLLPQQLLQKWLQQLQAAGARECSTVLWACTYLSRQQIDAVWGQTWAAFMQHVQQGSGQGVEPQYITKAVHAAAQLHRPPGTGELQLLLQTFLQPRILRGASSQHIADLSLALEQLLAQSGWQEGLSEQEMQQLLDQQQLLGEHLTERRITRQISSAETLGQLSDVSNQLCDSFDCIHAAAALVMFAKLSRKGQGGQLLQLLVRKWLLLLHEAGARECSNTIWACVNISKQHQQQVDPVWERTWAAFMQHVQQQSGEAMVPQNLANAVYAAAKLRKQPTAAELQLLVQAFLRPEVLAAADPQNIANTVWALSQLSQAPGWQGGVSERDVQQLLGEQQLRELAGGAPQGISNVLVALARMAAADPPLVGRDFAQQCRMQLLSLVSISSRTWNGQDVANTMWATAELGLPADVFVAKAVQAAQAWVPTSGDADLRQAAQACALLQYRDEAFLSLLLQQASVLLQQQPGKARSSSRALSAEAKANLAAPLAAAVAQLDMQQLAGPARDLVASSGIGQRAKLHPADPRRLWLLHAWLLQHQLLDGRGVTGLVTEQHLLQGKQDAAVYGTGVKVVQRKGTT